MSIFSELPYRYRYRYFSELPYRYRYRYRYFSKVSIYRQSICHIDISNRATIHTVYVRKLWDEEELEDDHLQALQEECSHAELDEDGFHKAGSADAPTLSG